MRSDVFSVPDIHPLLRELRINIGIPLALQIARLTTATWAWYMGVKFFGLMTHSCDVIMMLL